MKLSEFEEKLTTVSDSKLRRMLADSRKNGPEVAVRLILAEASRRGVSLEDDAEPPLPDYVKRPPAEAGSQASGTAPAAEAPEAASASGDPDAPATQGAWLAEEQAAGLPAFVKILLALIVLGGGAAGLFYLLHKNG